MHTDTRVDAPTSNAARVVRPAGGDTSRSVLSRHRRAISVTIVLAVVATVSIGRFLTASVDQATVDTPAVQLTPDMTIATLESAVATRPDDGRSWQKLGAAYAQKLVQSANPAYGDLSRRALDRADELLADDIATVVSRAQLALTLHQFVDARALGLRAQQLSKTNNDSLVVLVDANTELGRYDDAATELQELLDRKPGLAALSRVSYLRELHGDVDGALIALRQAESAALGASAFDLATVEAIRGDLLYNHGRLDDALTAYDDALKRSPGQLVATAGRARVLVSRGDFSGATTELTPVADVLPTATIEALLGDIATLDGRTADAQRAFALVRATTALQKASGAVVDLEAALFEADHGGDPKVVLDLATRAYSERPSIHGADAVAWARYRVGDIQGASASVEEALRLGTRDASLLFHAAAIHTAAGDLARGRRELSEAFAINPAFAIGNRNEVTGIAARLDLVAPKIWSPR